MAGLGAAGVGRRRHLLAVDDLSDEDLYVLARCPVEFKRGVVELPSLDGLTVGIYFRETSTRTRTAFSAAALRMGARIISYGPNDLQENTGESVRDTGRILSLMLDGLVMRTAGDPGELQQIAAQDRMAVINGMTSNEHPTQAVADLATMADVRGGISGVRVLYVGEGNNTAASLALALGRFTAVELHLRTPPGYGLDDETRKRAVGDAERHGAVIEERHDMESLPSDVDIVYTTRWQTTGTAKKDPQWRDVFAPFRVDVGLMDRYPSARFMHDLPAHRGEEVDAEVLDGPQSVVFRQAEYKLYSAMAVLAWCLGEASCLGR